MSLVTVQRSPTPSENGNFDQSEIDAPDCGPATSRDRNFNSECYFYVKGTAVILLHHDRTNTAHTSAGGEIEEHLQAMLRILSPQDTLTMAVRLQGNGDSENGSSHARYLAVVTSTSRLASCESETRESVLLGLDCFPGDKATIGVVIPIFASTHVRLDGDGGIAVDFDSALHLFRPVSVQAMWTVFQCLHKELKEVQNAKSPHLQVGKSSTRLVDYYHNHISTEDALRTQWERSFFDSNAGTADLGATSADAERFSTERKPHDNSIESQIHEHLKEVMQTVDLDDVTSKDIRMKVEEAMGRKLDEYKNFISRQMMVIMGQMDKASQIFPYLYLGTEWNACDWQWLVNNRVDHIVNVTNEVENFFPARLKYLKIRVSDEASTELMKHWNQTNQFIKEAKEKGGAVLVHCKKGISRSSSTVIAFAMKEYGWGLEQAMEHVKKKRDCITPNKGFVEQLKTFEGILDASKKRNQFDVQPSTSSVASEPLRCERRRGRRRSHHKLHHASHNAVEVSSRCNDNVDELGKTVRSLVGSFEAKGRTDDALRTSTHSVDGRRERPPVTFRLEKFTDWKSRHSIGVSVPNACSSASLRQARAVTISQ